MSTTKIWFNFQLQLPQLMNLQFLHQQQKFNHSQKIPDFLIVINTVLEFAAILLLRFLNSYSKYSVMQFLEKLRKIFPLQAPLLQFLNSRLSLPGILEFVIAIQYLVLGKS